MTQNIQLDLIDLIQRYPRHAGAKERSTSLEAANRIEASGKAEKLRQDCLTALRDGGATAKELAEYLTVDLNSIRPRLSELKARGLIEESGLRRECQHVWRLK